jgi:surfeit locus 1 family protein
MSGAAGAPLLPDSRSGQSGLRFPVVPTILVAAAVAAMVWLGIWQLHRKEWKEGLLTRYAAASTLPPVAWPSTPGKGENYYYRRASGFCLQVISWRAVAGRNRRDETGWSHVASCRTGAEGPGMQVDMGWSNRSDEPAWRGGPVTGIISPDRLYVIRLVSETAAPGLQPSARPSTDAISNNHLFYAIQWFCFALAAAVIYVLALRRRQKDAKAKPLP